MRILAILASIVLAACANAQATEDETSAETIACPHTDGFIEGPYVANEATARAIALALIEHNQSGERQTDYNLNVEDAGDSWAVFQVVRGYPSMRGGGGLAMRIAKCDGAISFMHWQR